MCKLDNEIIIKKKVIGRGAFGTVYLGVNAVTGAQVAVKEITAEQVTPERMTQFKRELEYLQCINHINVVKLLGFEGINEDSSTVARIFLEYVPMGSLQTLLQVNGRRFHEQFCRRVAKQVAQGIDQLHSLDIIHRDIKPHNILIATDGTVKVTDFGCCKTLQESLSTSTTIVGTTAFMSPEGISGKVTKSGDIWSLAATIVNLASGEVPWSEFSPPSNVALIFHIGSKAGVEGHHPQIPNHLSELSVLFLEACFKALPEDRPLCSDLLQSRFLTGIEAPLPGCEQMEQYTQQPSSSFSSLDDWLSLTFSSSHSNSDMLTDDVSGRNDAPKLYTGGGLARG